MWLPSSCFWKVQFEFGAKDIPSTLWYSPCHAEERDGRGKLEGSLLTGDFGVVFLWLDCGPGPSRTTSFAGLRCWENGRGAFQGLHGNFFILIFVTFSGEEIDWSMVDVWDDVRHLDWRALLLIYINMFPGNFRLRRTQWRQFAL